MRSSKYSIFIVPDNDGKDRSFTISRFQMTSLIISLIIIITVFIFFIVYALPRLMHYNSMEADKAEYAAERVKILELARDLNRIEQMDRQIRKTLGSELELSDISNQNDSTSVIIGNLREKDYISVSYVDNIPSHYPVNGYVTQRKHIKNLYRNQNHYGIDIAVKAGEPVYASASGFVVFSGWTYDFGNYIILYHGDDYFTIYGHNNANLAETKDFISRGEVIATSGETGIASGPHLHFEIWKDGTALNPLEFFPKFKQKDMSVNNYEQN